MVNAVDFEVAIDEVVARFDRTDGPGLSVGVLQDGEVKLSKGYGLADVKRQVPNAPGAPMRIASLSKQFLCTVVAMLDNEGALSIHDDIRAHIPTLPDYGRRIALAHLMSSQSGIRDFLELHLLSGGNFAKQSSAESCLDLARSVRGLNFEPGTDFAYSNTGFMLLTRVVEAIEGRPLEESLERRIFGPLAMRSTRLVRCDDPPIPNRASPYVESATGLEPGLWGIPLDGAGGVVSTVDDLTIWAQNLRSPRVGSAKMFGAMTTASPFADGSPSIYGYGFSVLNYRGQPTFGHHGQLPGLFAEVAVFPDLDTTIALIANTSALNPFVIGRQIADAILGDRLEPKTPDPRGAALDGIYHDATRDAVLELTHTPDGTVVATTAMMDAPLTALTPGRFGIMWPMSTLDLVADGDALTGSAGALPVHFSKLHPFRPMAGASNQSARFFQADLRSVWAMIATDDGLHFRIEGPLGVSDFDLHPLAPGLFQARMREEPCGPYRPILRVETRDGRRQLTMTTDRTFGLSANEVAPSGQ